MPSQDTRISFLQNPWPPCKKKHLSLQNGCAQRQKIMFKVGWPPSFCREKPSTKWWCPASYTRIFFGSGSFHIYFCSKKIQKPIRTSPSHESLDWLARIPRLTRTFFDRSTKSSFSRNVSSLPGQPPISIKWFGPWQIYKKQFLKQCAFPIQTPAHLYKMTWPLTNLQKSSFSSNVLSPSRHRPIPIKCLGLWQIYKKQFLNQCAYPTPISMKWVGLW